MRHVLWAFIAMGFVSVASGQAFGQDWEMAATRLWNETDSIVIECPEGFAAQFEQNDSRGWCAVSRGSFDMFRFDLDQLVEDGWFGLEQAGPWELDRDSRLYSRSYYGSRDVTRIVFAEDYFSRVESLVVFVVLE